MTTIPRWTLDPRPGTSRHERVVPDDLVTALLGLAREAGVPTTTALLAAHAHVLGVLSGEQQVVAGYVSARDAGPSACRLPAMAGSWRSLLLSTRAAEQQPAADPDAAAYETVLDPTGAGHDLAGGTALRIGLGERDGDLLLRLAYRTEVLDPDAADRIAGYHLAALALMTADPDADPARRSLLTDHEVRSQLEELAGPRRELPDARAHELFEQRAQAQPDTVAASHGDQAWTYAELNARANRLGRALLARGLRREDVVAVVTERDLDWLAAVLAVWKAGGAYLPIEPHFPAERIATTLTRSRATLVLTEPGSTTTLDKALDGLPGVGRLLVDTAYAEEHPDGDLGVEVRADQLAYLYFTSGSTGEPKGAMCEQAGMLNHLLAKIDDLEIGAGTVVAQTAPQCFDISLWQLVSPLLVGGRTELVGQDEILDVQRFVATVARSRVEVLQVVPSYLEAVIAQLQRAGHDQPDLPDLSYVSVTGEAVTRDLVERWFAVRPDVPLVNAYGLTETSDDTNHEVMRRAPEGDRVPLGRPIANVGVRVVDEHLQPVPLGAPGEIVFSGVCVGRGYVNDPERTAASYVADPVGEGGRLYRSGDHGRWRPDGKLEFLGRRDAQVKIRGFRVEPGDVESALARLPGVRQGAVVVARPAGQGRQLVAFWAGSGQQDPQRVRALLADLLPAYMVPAVVHRREQLPVTANGKVDRAVLAGLAEELAPGTEHVPPSGAVEQRLAAAWSTVLGVPAESIGRHDHFFDRGGSSLAAVKLVIALDRAVSLEDVTTHPVLADLALRLVDGQES